MKKWYFRGTARKTKPSGRSRNDEMTKDAVGNAEICQNLRLFVIPMAARADYDRVREN